VSNIKFHTKTQSAVIEAPSETAFEIVSELKHWPQFFPPAVYAEAEDEAGEVVRRWALDGDTVHHWISRRQIDRLGLRIVAEQNECEEPLASIRTEWSFKPQHAGACLAELTLDVGVEGDSPEATEAAVSRLGHAEKLLGRVKATAERWDELQQLVVSFEDPLFIAGKTADVYDFLYEADKWPERVPHVTALSMTEDQPGIQFFDMDTVTPEGRAHTTRSVRVCRPRKIIYKQISLPGLLDAHTGHWLFTESPEGVTVTARHTATIKPSALNLLGENTTVADARRYLRRVLSTNSLQTLRHAQAHAEERASV
jgi:ribosome-associated toxin RatA of RatAB toxin-antitoxin module